MADIFFPPSGARERCACGNADSCGKYEQPDDEMLQEDEKQRASARVESCTPALCNQLLRLIAGSGRFIVQFFTFGHKNQRLDYQTNRSAAFHERKVISHDSG